MELGCDPRGYSRAGNDIMVWYCVVLAGRQSLELNKMHQVSTYSLVFLAMKLYWVILIWIDFS